MSRFLSNFQNSSTSPIPTCSTFVKTLANNRHFCRMCHFQQNCHSQREPFATSRGVARIFSEVRTILQIALHPTRNSPNPPPPITTTTTTTNKSFLDKKFVYVVSLTVFFCLWITLSGVWLMHLTYLSHNKATCFSGFVTLFCYWLRFVVFKQMQHVNPHWKGANLVKSQWILKPKFKVIPMPCKFQKFAMFCSVNNLSNLSGYFFAFDHTIL